MDVNSAAIKSSCQSTFQSFLTKYVPSWSGDSLADIVFSSVKVDKNSFKKKWRGRLLVGDKVLKRDRKYFQRTFSKRTNARKMLWMKELSNNCIKDVIKVDKLYSNDTNEMRKFVSSIGLEGMDVSVTESSNASYIGVSGFVGHETRNTLTIVNPETNTLKVVPKSSCVFTISLLPGRQKSDEVLKIRIAGSVLLGFATKRLKHKGSQ